MVTTYKREYLAELPGASDVGTTLASGSLTLTNNAAHAGEITPSATIAANRGVALTCMETDGWRYFEPAATNVPWSAYQYSIHTTTAATAAQAERLELDVQLVGGDRVFDWLWPDTGILPGTTYRPYALSYARGRLIGSSSTMTYAGDLSIAAVALGGRLRWAVMTPHHFQYGLLPDEVIAGNWTHWEVRRIPTASGYLVAVIVDGHGVFGVEVSSLYDPKQWYIAGTILSTTIPSGLTEAPMLRLANIKLSRLYEAEATAPSVDVTAVTGDTSATLSATVDTGVN